MHSHVSHTNTYIKDANVLPFAGTPTSPIGMVHSPRRIELDIRKRNRSSSSIDSEKALENLKEAADDTKA